MNAPAPHRAPLLQLATPSLGSRLAGWLVDIIIASVVAVAVLPLLQPWIVATAQRWGPATAGQWAPAVRQPTQPPALLPTPRGLRQPTPRLAGQPLLPLFPQCCSAYAAHRTPWEIDHLHYREPSRPHSHE